MPTIEEGPSRDQLNQLNGYVNRLLRIGYESETDGGSLKIGRDDHLGFMLVRLLSVQLEHLQSVSILAIAEQGRDAALISRTMLEALGILTWVLTEDTDNRAFRWRAFSYVVDQKLIDRQDAEGKAVDPRIRANTKAGIDAHGHLFLKKSAKNVFDATGRLPDDPYVSRWTPVSAQDMIKNGLGEELYSFYNQSSDWAHGEIGGTSRGLHRSGDQFKHTTLDPHMEWTALALGFQTLYMTLIKHHEHFGLELPQALTELFKEYEAFGNEAIPT